MVSNKYFSNSQFYINTTANNTQSTRQAKLNILSENNGSTPIGDITFTQDAPTPYFGWGSSTSTTTTAVTVGTTSYNLNTASKSYNTNYTGLTVVYNSGDNLVQNSSLTASEFSVTASTNPTTSERSGTYYVYGKWNGVESKIGEITIKQKGAGPSFVWTNETTGTSATTFSATGGTIGEGYITNVSNPDTAYSLSGGTWISNLGWNISNNTVTGTVAQYSVTTGTGRTTYVYVKSGSTRVATIYIKQDKAQESDAFSWDSSSVVTSTTATTTIAGTGGTGSQPYYVTGYTSVSVTGGDSWLWTSISQPSNGSGTFSFSADTRSPGDSSRNTIVTVKSGNQTIGQITVNQNGIGEATIVAYSGSSTSITSSSVSYSSTSGKLKVKTENQGWSLKSKPNWITSVSPTSDITSNTSITISYPANTSKTPNTGIIVFQGSVAGEASFSIEQGGAPYFEWSNGQSAITVEIEYNATGVTADCTTSYSSLRTGGTSTSWLTSISITTTSFTAATSTNTGDSPRTANTIEIRTGTTSSSKVGEIIVVQKANSTPPTPTTRTLTIRAASFWNFEVNNARLDEKSLEFLFTTSPTYAGANPGIVSNCSKITNSTSNMFTNAGSIVVENQPMTTTSITVYVYPANNSDVDFSVTGSDWMSGVNFDSNGTEGSVIGTNSFSVTFGEGTNTITLSSRNPNGVIGV